MPKGKEWSIPDLDWLKTNYERVGLYLSAQFLKRSPRAITHKASKLKLRRRGRNRKPRDYIYDGYLYRSEVNDRYAVHRRLMEDYLGRKLLSKELIHHKDGDTLNNNLSNLILTTRKEHLCTYHREILMEDLLNARKLTDNPKEED